WIIGAMLLLMAWPSAYYPFARAWYPLTDLLGQGASLVLLTLIYGVFVIPLGLARRALGRDPLQLRSFRKARSSVFHTRDHTFTSSDLEQLY
ncbi:MAG TPA: hypothetical protein P5550_09580, partial [Bacteroidales bacterium]|nr:hypothetical protein [Bacteroidales bacterium]